MKELIVISAIGADRPDLVHDITRIILECSGNVLDSRITAMGTLLSAQLTVSGQWHTLARLENEFRKFGETAGLQIALHRTEPRPPRPDAAPYTVDAICIDQPGILYKLAGFFTARGIEIADVNTRSFTAVQTGAAMFAAQLLINVPGKLHIAALREEFMELCDSMNLDAILEPLKG